MEARHHGATSVLADDITGTTGYSAESAVQAHRSSSWRSRSAALQQPSARACASRASLQWEARHRRATSALADTLAGATGYSTGSAAQAHRSSSWRCSSCWRRLYPTRRPRSYGVLGHALVRCRRNTTSYSIAWPPWPQTACHASPLLSYSSIQFKGNVGPAYWNSARLRSCSAALHPARRSRSYGVLGHALARCRRNTKRDSVAWSPWPQTACHARPRLSYSGIQFKRNVGPAYWSSAG